MLPGLTQWFVVVGCCRFCMVLWVSASSSSSTGTGRVRSACSTSCLSCCFSLLVRLLSCLCDWFGVLGPDPCTFHPNRLLGESVSWFFTYRMLNTTGETVCCPYPAMLVFSTIVKIMSGMVARVVTTLLCLGYGVVRPCISWPEIFVVSGLGVCYFIAVGALEISHIANQSDGDVHPPAIWELLVIVTNACFGGWIFTSLALTKKNLAAFGQVRRWLTSVCNQKDADRYT